MAGAFRKKFSERPRKCSRSFSGLPLVESTFGNPKYVWEPQIIINKGAWSLQSISRTLSASVRRGTPLFFSEVVPERASQSWSWDSQQYWGHFWIERRSESVSNFGAYRDLARVLLLTSNPQNCRNKQKKTAKGHLCFLHQTSLKRYLRNGQEKSRLLSWRRLGISSLEAQQRYFAYRALLVAIVSQNNLVLVFCGASHNYRTIRCKMGVSRRCVCVKPSTKGGSHHFGEM